MHSRRAGDRGRVPHEERRRIAGSCARFPVFSGVPCYRSPVLLGVPRWKAYFCSLLGVCICSGFRGSQRTDRISNQSSPRVAPAARARPMWIVRALTRVRRLSGSDRKVSWRVDGRSARRSLRRRVRLRWCGFGGLARSHTGVQGGKLSCAIPTGFCYRNGSGRRIVQGLSPRRSGVVGRLPKTSGFQVDSAGIGLNCRAAEPGTRGCRFHFAEHAREVKG